MIERSEVAVIYLGPCEKVPDDVTSGTVLVIEVNKEPFAIWIDSGAFMEVWLATKSLSDRLGFALDDAHFLSTPDFNAAVDAALQLHGLPPVDHN